jgi:hypothetical protein
VDNETGKTLTVNALFKEGSKLYYAATGTSVLVERDVDHGDWVSVDPLVKLTFSVEGANKLVLPLKSTTGVLALHFRVELKDNTLKAVKLND